MKLKKLELTGFKSFLEKTRIEFDHGVSAIVGPNGCGKSNVIDAIRWAMGEQSLKQLRGKSREDIIFGGADGKAPSNLAEVSLTLLNDNGSAPEALKDYHEIQVTRRLYRSGETAYYLNKRPCRLKDIHNLFLGSGMGSRSYAIIEQGNIGAITDADPGERRVFIEEAAGVSRFKARKKEALQKVDGVNHNLLRLKDVISEVERQSAGLKRQAKKAERYEKIREKLQKLDVLVNIGKHTELSKELEETHSLLKSLKDDDISQAAKLKKLDSTVEKIKLERTKLGDEISRHKTNQFDARRRIDNYENDLDRLRIQTKQRKKEIAQLASARTELEGKNLKIAGEVQQYEHEITKLDKDILDLNERLSSEQGSLSEMKARFAPLNDKLEKHKKILMELAGQEARINNICQTASRNKESIERRLKRVDEEAFTAEKQVLQLSDAEKKAEKAIAEKRESIQTIDSTIRELREKLEIKAERLGRQVKAVQTKELKRKESRSQYLALKKMDENFDWYKDGVKAICKDAASDEKKGKNDVLGVVADILAPEPGFETAVEAALGEALQFVIVKDQKAGRSSIELLTTRNLGRGGFIPLESLKSLFKEDNKPDPSGLLLNHVRIKPGFEKVADSLLGRVVAVSDLQEALQIWNRNGLTQTVVTIDGFCITEQGIMAGGSKEKFGGILEKKREIKELEDKLDQMEKEINSSKKIQERIEIKVRDLETDLQRQIELKNHTAQMEIEAEKSLFKVSEELKGARRRLEIVHLEQDQLLGEQNDIDVEMEKSEQERNKIVRMVQSAQEDVAKTSAEIENLSSDLEARNETVVDMQLKLTSLNAHYENSVGNLRRLKEFQADGKNRLEQIASDIVIKSRKQEKDLQKIEDREEGLKRLYDDLVKWDKLLEETEADYLSVDARLKDSDREKSEIESRRERNIEKIRYVEMQQVQRQMKIDNLLARLEERYNQKFGRLKAKHCETPGKALPSREEMEAALERNRERLRKLGEVHMGAINEYEQLKTRYDFLIEQRDDLLKAIEDLHKVIRKINRITQEKFRAAFDSINEKMAEVFPRLFEGGGAKLVLTHPDKPLESGVEFMIHPPGKKLTRLSLLSGGEKALSAIAFIFSIFLIRPASFCLLDEIDAPLDEANVYRFNSLLQMIGETSQIIMITHNKRSMEFSDTLFGVTMEKKGISKLVSVNLNGNGHRNGRGPDLSQDFTETAGLN